MSILFKNVNYSYKSRFTLDVNIQIPNNSWTVIVGKSGAGKSTLLKLLIGIIKPNFGEVIFDSKKSGMGFIFQNPDDQIIQVSLEKELAFNLENQAVDVDIIRDKVQNTLKEYDFDNRGEESPNNLSGGEKQRLALAATLISNPNILIFDEPSSFLDYEQKEKLYRRIEKLKQDGKTIIWTSHELDEILLADHVIELDNGHVIYEGDRDNYLHKILKNDIMFKYLNDNTSECFCKAGNVVGNKKS